MGRQKKELLAKITAIKWMESIVQDSEDPNIGLIDFTWRRRDFKLLLEYIKAAPSPASKNCGAKYARLLEQAERRKENA